MDCPNGLVSGGKMNEKRREGEDKEKDKRRRWWEEGGGRERVRIIRVSEELGR